MVSCARLSAPVAVPVVSAQLEPVAVAVPGAAVAVAPVLALADASLAELRGALLGEALVVAASAAVAERSPAAGPAADTADAVSPGAAQVPVSPVAVAARTERPAHVAFQVGAVAGAVSGSAAVGPHDVAAVK